MTVATDLYSTITADSTLNTLVSGRVSPVVDRGGDLPCFVYSFTDQFPRSAMGGGKTITRAGLKLDFYTTSYADIDTVKTRLDAIFNSRQFALSNTNIIGSQINGSIETLDDDDDGAYRLITEITLFY